MARWRHLIVAVSTVPALILYVGLALWISTYVTEIHFLIDLVFFLIAGLIWIPAAGWVVKWLALHEAK
ncbi:DUF2842 domain-containing protein [Alphaproteobacteria bacterium]|nr:DUF2842 domain-containing protein [Alphaproteobacteria bacterium]